MGHVPGGGRLRWDSPSARLALLVAHAEDGERLGLLGVDSGAASGSRGTGLEGAAKLSLDGGVPLRLPRLGCWLQGQRRQGEGRRSGAVGPPGSPLPGPASLPSDAALAGQRRLRQGPS